MPRENVKRSLGTAYARSGCDSEKFGHAGATHGGATCKIAKRITFAEPKRVVRPVGGVFPAQIPAIAQVAMAASNARAERARKARNLFSQRHETMGSRGDFTGEVESRVDRNAAMCDGPREMNDTEGITTQVRTAPTTTTSGTRTCRTLNLDSIDVGVQPNTNQRENENFLVRMESSRVQSATGINSSQTIHSVEAGVVDYDTLRGGPDNLSQASVATPRARRTIRAKFDGMFVSPPTLTPGSEHRKLPSIQAVMKFFGLSKEEKQFFCKHLPSKKTRSSESFWTTSNPNVTNEAYQRTVVSNLVVHLLECISEILCGCKIAPTFLQLFISWLAPLSCLDDKMAMTAATVLTKTRKSSVEQRSIRALLCELYPLKTLEDVSAQVDGFSIGRRAYQAGKNDMQILLDEGNLEKTQYSRQNFDPHVVDCAVHHILSMQNVAFLSWGTKTIKLDGECMSVPVIQRKKPVNVMFDEYDTLQRGKRKVSERSFYRIASVLTHGSTQPRTAVNYVTGFLINDNFQLLTRIVRDLLPERSPVILQNLEVLREWLKYGGAQIFEDSSLSNKTLCPRQMIKFGLLEAENAPSDDRTICCDQCWSMNTICKDVRFQLEEKCTDVSTLQVVDDSFEKMDLFLGHRVRVVNQQRAIQQVVDDIKARCIRNRVSDEAVIVIDFKMKLEPIYFREKTVDHYGKRGLSWHGAILRYWAFDPETDGAQESKIYIDHISNADNKQDKEAVVALMEGLFASIHHNFEFIKRVTVQSDNATCYQNTLVALMLPLLGALHDIKILRYIHSETQDGKSVLDAHFATAARKIKSWVSQGHNCTTPEEVIVALNSDGGLPNCLAELVDFDREKLKVLCDQTSVLTKSLTSILTRVNDVVYSHPSSFSCPPEWHQRFDFQLWPSFILKLFAYSGIGDGIEVTVDTSRGRCRVQNETPSLPRGRQPEAADQTEEDSIGGAGENECSCDDLGGPNLKDVSDDEFDVESITEDEEDDLDLDDPSVEQEIAVPNERVGVISGIRVIQTAQMRIRRSRPRRENEIPHGPPRGCNVAERSVTSYAKRCLVHMHNGGDVGAIVEPKKLSSKLIFCASVCTQRNHAPIVLKQGWARRPKKGSMYGAKYIGFYKADVDG